ncbi:MAG TPA: nucleoside-diphosphate kinase [Candidatus Azoamicus sp. OHIO2]
MSLYETLILIKPDAIEQKRVGRIITMLEKYFILYKIKSFLFSNDSVENFYFEHKNKDFYNELISFMTSNFVIAIILKGDDDIILKVRKLVGHTDFRKADKNSIRGRFATSLTKNVVHASDSFESYIREFNLVFKNTDD